MMLLLRALRSVADGSFGRVFSEGRLRGARQRGRRVTAAVLSPVIAAASLVSVPVAVTAAAVAVAGAAATAVVTAAPARASVSLPVLVVQVNGESSAPEAALLTAAGYTVTQVTQAALQAMSKSTFQGYTAVVIGDPSSSGTCPSGWTPSTSALGSNWEGWVTGNVAVLGTNAGLAASLASSGNTAAATLITDAAGYAAAQPGTTVTKTGLYLSLGCAYASAAQGTQVSILDGIYTDTAATQTIGAAGHVTVNGSLSCADSGTVNKWEATAAGTFSGFTSSSLASGAPGWPSSACPVQEGFDSWPAMFTPVAYDAASTTGNFTASDGATGQPYVLLGAPLSAATTALAPATGGEVPAGTTSGGTANPAAGGVSQSLAAGSVNTENGDLTQSGIDVSVPTFGPALRFGRTYDSGAAQQQAKTGTASAMGAGWTNNWASSLTTARPVEGDIYTLDGLRSNLNVGGYPGSQVMGNPAGVVVNGGNVYMADSTGNRVLEVAHGTGTQWGQSMTGGDTYVVAGSGSSAGGVLNHPQGIAFDSAGDMYIADTWDSRIEEVPSSSKTQWGVSMTANQMYTVAGSASGSSGYTGDGGAPTSALLHAPGGIAFDSLGDMYIADGGNNRVQEIFVTGGQAWGITMTAGDIYTVAGNASGTAGIAGDGGASRSAYLSNPTSVSTDTANDVYITDAGNNRIQEMFLTGGSSWGVTGMAAHGIYTIAGSATGTAGSTGNNVAATSALLDGPQDVVWSGSNLYIADALNNTVREVAGTAHTQWGSTSMTANDIYTIAGTGSTGHTGDGGAAKSATMNNPLQAVLDTSGNMYIADAANNCVREVTTAGVISTYAGNGYTVASTGNGGPATQAALNSPLQEAFDSHGDIYIADAGNNRIQEIASWTHTQWGIAMTGGDVYTVAGHGTGQTGGLTNGGQAIYSYLNDPWSIVVDPAGNLYITDTGNNRIQEVPATTGTQWGQSMTAGDIYTVAGSASGTAGYSGAGGPAASALMNHPVALTMDPAGDIYIADSYNNRVREIAKTSGTQWGQSMTAGDIYTIAGNGTGGPYGSGGPTGEAGPATSAELWALGGLALDATGDLYIGDGGNNRVEEVAATTHAQWGKSMTAGDIYTVTSAPGGGATGDGGPASLALIAGAPSLAIDPSGDLYIADEQNNRIQEIANVTGTQWGQSMTAGDEYTVAGNAGRASGNSGDGGPATSALMANTTSISIDPQGDLYITDSANGTVREVASATANAIAPAPGQTSALAIAPSGSAPGGLTVTQPGGAQVTFWAQSGGICATGYTASGSYCILPQDQGATLTYNSSTQVYTFSPAPGSTTYTYLMGGTTGQLTSETDPAGNTLTITNSSPSPGSAVTTGGGTGTCPSSAASCQTITSASGRALILGYNGSADTGQITSVTDPMNRTWTYAYTGTAPNVELQSVTDPAPNTSTSGSITSYQYGDNSGGPVANPLLANDLISIISPNSQPGGPDAGDATQVVYTPAGQVTKVTDPMGWKTTLSYCANLTAGNCTSSAASNWLSSSTGNGFTTVTDPDGNLTVYDYDQGTLAAQSSWTSTTSGLTLTAETDNVPDTSAGTLLDTASADADGNTTTTSYNTAGKLTSSTSPGPNGALATITTAYTSTLQRADCGSTADAASTAACSADSPPSPVAPGGAITSPSSAPPQGVTYALYDTDGNEIYTTVGVYEPGGSTAAYSQTTYQLYKNNSVTLNGANIACTNNTPPSPSLPCAKINADGVVTQLAYDPEGDLTSSATPDGNSGGELATTTYGYDADGEQTSTTAPDGNLTGANVGNYTTATAYNNDGQKTSVTQAGGTGATVTPRVTIFGYDADGNQTTTKSARTYTTTTAYNADDKPSLVTNPDNNSTLTCYDGDGNTTQTVPAVGVAANSLGMSSCPTAYPSGYGTRLAADATVDTFDALGQRVIETSPAPAGQSGNETTTYVYDSAGNVVQVTSPPASNGGSSQVTVDTYTAGGKLATQTTGYGTSAASTISFCYDPNGNKTSMVYADGNTSGTAPCSVSSPWTVTASPQVNYQTTYSYDSNAELVSTTAPATTAAPSGATTTSTYDDTGNLLTSTDPNGIITTSTYTPENLMASVSYSGSSAHSVSYTYDADGKQTGMTDATGTSSYVYDAFGELTSATNGAGRATTYGYDADGDVTGITYPLPSPHSWATTTAVSYGYDNADKPTSVTDFAGNSIALTNTPDGFPSRQVLGSTGDSIASTYDNDDMYSSITLQNSSSSLQSFTYSDAPSGQPLKETDTPASSTSPASYTYDAQGRVTSMVPGAGSTLSYGFDPSSELTTLPTGASTTYDGAGELTSSTLAGTTTSYAYSAAGQWLAAKQGSTPIASSTWNGAGQVTAYSNSAANMTSVTYDGYGLRAAATFTPAGGSPATQVYTWNAESSTPQLLMDSASAYIYDGGTAPAEQVNLATGAVTYLVTDAIGSVRGVVNSAGTLSAAVSYDAWGNPSTTGGLTASTPFGYAGGYTDPTDLIYLVHRYYDPQTGQFTSLDPLIGQTFQPYAYANGDPVSQVDPSGTSGGLYNGSLSVGWGGSKLQYCVGVDAYLAAQVCGYYTIGGASAAYSWWQYNNGNGVAVAEWQGGYNGYFANCPNPFSTCTNDYVHQPQILMQIAYQGKVHFWQHSNADTNYQTAGWASNVEKTINSVMWHHSFYPTVPKQSYIEFDLLVVGDYSVRGQVKNAHDSAELWTH